MTPEKGFGKLSASFLEWFGRLWRSRVTAGDRTELPFNRAERESVTHLANKEGDIAAFGSTRDLTIPGTPIFVNCQFPTLDRDAMHSRPITVGPYAIKPYSVSSIFNVSAMSYGALSPVAVRALSLGAKLAGAWLNTGEGGLAPAHLEGGCDIVLQIGTAKYGVRDAEGRLDLTKVKALVAAHAEIKMIELKLAQGAKPGKGGILPGIKVTREIAEIRGIPEGQDLISPNRHQEISNVGELLDMIKLIRDASGLPVGFKTVLSEAESIDVLCAEIKKRGAEHAPDFITLDGGDGGTGAAPTALMDNVGLTLKDALPMLIGGLNRHGLRERIPVIASGKLITPASVAWALCVGATFVNSARGPMRALGCVQARECDKNTCPMGITTTHPKLQKRLNPADKSVKVANYILGIDHEVETIAHSCGVTEPRQLGPEHVRIVPDVRIKGGTESGPPPRLSEMYPDLIRKAPQAPVL